MEKIFTTHGDLPLDSLTKTIIEEDAPDGFVTATEYRLGDEIVRRDVHVAVKAHAVLNLEAQEF